MRGVTVTLYEGTKTGVDGFNADVVSFDTGVQVENVLVGEPSTDDITSSTEMYGKKLECMLGIPKGDTHDWQDKVVEWVDAYGTTHRLKTFGFPITGIEANIPTKWHKKVRCEKYGG